MHLDNCIRKRKIERQREVGSQEGCKLGKASRKGKYENECWSEDTSSKSSVKTKDDEREPKKRSSYKERRANAWAPRAEEGRDKLRKAAVRSKYPTTRRYPNGATRPG